jgi:superfamily I DNA and/or RNA helicase
LASRLFYQGRVTSGVAPEIRPPLIPNLPSICRVDVSQACEERLHGSFFNEGEVSIVRRLVTALQQNGVDDIAVATLFVAQAQRLRARIPEVDVRVATVDALQGAEAKVVIVSTVRTAPDGSTKFVESPERVNVLLTRAKNHLILVGNEHALARSDLWSTVWMEANPITGEVLMY